MGAIVRRFRRNQMQRGGWGIAGFVSQLTHGHTAIWLPLTEAVGSIADNAAYTAAPGSELLTNGDFSAWTGDDPDGWTVAGETGSVAEVTERDPDQLYADSPTAGGAANLYNSGGGTAVPILSQNVLTLGDSYRLRTVISAYGLGTLKAYASGFGLDAFGIQYTAVGDFTGDFIATQPGHFQYRQVLDPGDATITLVSLVKSGELDGAIAGTTTLGQTGLHGGNHAYLFDGATSLITVYDRASIQGLTDFSLWALFNPEDAGENANGTLFSKDGEFELRFNSSSRDLTATINYATTNAAATTSTTLSANQWHSVGLRIDDSSKQIDLFVDGVEASYASRISGVGSRVSNTNNLIVGNNAAVNQTLAGLLDEALLVDRVLTANEFALLQRLA